MIVMVDVLKSSAIFGIAGLIGFMLTMATVLYLHIIPVSLQYADTLQTQLPIKDTTLILQLVTTKLGK